MSQYEFKMNPKVNSPHADVTGAALGSATGEAWNDKDIGKAVKLVGPSAYGAVSADDELEGFITSMEAHTVNSGFPFGSVQRDKRTIAIVGTVLKDDGSGGFDPDPIVLGAYVVADAYVGAVGTSDGGYPRIKNGTPTKFLWRVIEFISGDGTTIGDKVVIERV